MALKKHGLQTVLLMLAMSISGIAGAQTSNGTIAGSITDPTGAVVSKATVSAVSSQYGEPHQTRTDSAGTYRLESLEPGTYRVTITGPGFSVLSVSGVIVNGSLTTSVNAKLELATIRQTLEVVASAGQVIDTQSGQLGGTLNQEELKELPYATLNGAELAMTLPGVQDASISVPQKGAIQNTALTNGASFSVNGSRPRANNFLIDGQDDNDYGIAGQAYQPTNWGAIQEVTILTNAYNAEYGRGGGSVTNYIYKSGTNHLHGDLWEINRNSALAAIPAQDVLGGPVSKNPYDNENTFGFDIGGPVKKNQLFFFGAAQWDRERLLATGPLFNLPTAAGIATLKSLLPNPNISLFLNSIGSLVSPGLNGVTTTPLGNDANGNPRPDVQIGNFQVKNVPATSNFADWNYRMDWQITDRDIVTGSAIRDTGAATPNVSGDAGALPNFQTKVLATSEIFRGQWVHTISSSLINELRLSYTNINFPFDLTPQTAAGPLANIPYIQFGSDIRFPSIGVNSNFPQGRAHHTWQVQEALSHSAGKHTIKAGADITVLSLNDTLMLDTRGSIFYNSGGMDSSNATYSSLGNFVDDYTGQNPGGITKVFGNRTLASSTTMYAPYVQDTWRVRNNVSFDLGLRYEYWGALANSLPYPAFNVHAGFGALNSSFPSMYGYRQIPDRRNFAPRIGLAYAPHWGHLLFGDGKTVFRGGYGIFYDGLFSNILDLTAGSQPNVMGGSYPSPAGRGVKNASTTGIGSIKLVDSTLLVYSMASNLHNPLTQQWNVSVQRELPLELVMTLSYVGTRGEHLFANQDFNPAIGFDSSFNYIYTNSNFGEISILSNAGDSRYDSAQVELERKIRSGLVLRGAYTYSKFMDDASEIFISTGTSSYSQVLTNQRSDWGPSTFDRRHRFTLAYVWKTPYFHNNALLRTLTNQWEWSGIATVESGTPNTPEVGFDNIVNGHPNSRPDLANPAAPLNSLGIDGGNFFVGLTPGVYYDFLCLFNTSGPCPSKPYSAYHFVVPANVPGNAQRNSVFGPGQIYFDTAIQRDFPIHIWKAENQTLSFRADMFNALNHPNLFTPSYTMTDVSYNNTAITIQGGRQIKLWLKYSF